MSSNTRSKQAPITVLQTIHDVLLAVIERGQLLVFGIFVVILYPMYRMSDEMIAKFMFEVLAAMNQGHLWVALLLGMSIAGWYMHVRSLQKLYKQQFQQLSEENESLKQRLGAQSTTTNQP